MGPNTDNPSAGTKKTGILLLNLGGPWTLKDVKPFLYNLFSDPAILVGIPSPIRQMIAFAIAQVKGPLSIQNYKDIGGGSPQLKWTTEQAQGLERLLNRAHHVKTAIGMRASPPMIEQGLKDLRDWGAERVVLMPLFPQYSTTTTGTCFGEAKRVLRKWGWQPEVREVERWPDHPLYIGLLRRTVDEAIMEAETARAASAGAEGEAIHVLFSAHSLPMKIIERGDPYPRDVERTIQALTRDLKHPWSLCFQSRNGKMPWLQPYTEDAIAKPGREGIKRVVIVPISFVSDHIETLYELDQLYADEAKKVGITNYHRARSFNGDPAFHRVLESVVTESVPEFFAVGGKGAALA